jgi:hypothetical protein
MVRKNTTVKQRNINEKIRFQPKSQILLFDIGVNGGKEA